MIDVDKVANKFLSALKFFENDIAKIRAGRANPAMLDEIKIELYGNLMPLSHAANISIPEPSMLLVTPFDPNNISAISTAIRNDSSLGLNPSDNGHVVRVPIPALTEERRKILVKQMSEKLEDARITLRNIRQEAYKDIKISKENKEISEDEAKRLEKAIDNLQHVNQEKLDEAFSAKQKNILTL